MPRPVPKISLPVRLAHGLTIVLFILLTLTGLRLAWVTRADWLSPEILAIIDWLAPTGAIYQLHTLFGVLFAATGFFYLAYLIFTGENRRLTNLFHRHEYSFTKKVVYFGSFLLAAASLTTGLTIYAGLFQGGPGYLFNSFVHQWSFRLLALFAVLHTLEVIISRRSRINCMFFDKRFVGFVVWPSLLIAAALAIVGGTAFHQFLHRTPTLTCRQLTRPVVIDGYAYDEEWHGSDSIVVQTHSGANFMYSAAPVTVKTFRNHQRIYFLLQWRDETRSLNRHLIKTDTGWIPEQSAYLGPFGEDIYFEDQAALYFSRSEGCAATCHVGSGDRMGLHYTGGDTADVWVWMAVSTNPSAEADDRHWTALTNDTTGGRFFDNIASGGYRYNFDSVLLYPYYVPTHRIFRDWLLYGAPGYEEYDHQIDTFPVGHRIPAILVARSTGDRGDIEARGIWRSGVWTLEMARLLSTGSAADVRFDGEMYFCVAVFDNAEKQHAYHLTPIRLVVE